MGVVGRGGTLELEPRGGVGWALLTNTSPSNFDLFWNFGPRGLSTLERPRGTTSILQLGRARKNSTKLSIGSRRSGRRRRFQPAVRGRGHSELGLHHC